MTSVIRRREAIGLATSAVVVSGGFLYPNELYGQAPKSVISGNVKLGEKTVPKGVLCFVRADAKNQERGVYEEDTGNFYFPNLPKTGERLSVWLMYNNRRIDFTDLSRKIPSHLEVRFPDPSAKGAAIDPVSLIQTIASIASFCLDARADETLLIEFRKNEKLFKFDAVFASIRRQLSSEGVRESLNEDEIIMVSHFMETTTTLLDKLR